MFLTEYLDSWWIILIFDYYFAILNMAKYVSVLKQYTGRCRAPGLHIMHIIIIFAYSDYVAYSDDIYD